MPLSQYRRCYYQGNDEYHAILAELKAQGRNLNQLTTLANMGRLQILRSDELIDRYADLCQKLMEISGEVT